MVAVDGKALRHSFQHAWDRQMIHLVSAWAAGNQLVLGQLAVADKSNERHRHPPAAGDGWT